MKTKSELMKNMIGLPMPKELSPVGNWLGYVLTGLEEGIVILTMTPRPEMANPAGMVHGGILTSICDEAMGIAVLTMGQEHYHVTVDININFLYGIPIGTELRAKGMVVRSGKKIAFTKCEIYDTQDRLCVSATSNLVSTSAKNPNEYAKS